MLEHKWFSSCLATVFVQSIKARYYVENEDVAGEAPTGDAPTTSHWSTIVLPTNVCIILEVWWYCQKITQIHYNNSTWLDQVKI